MFADVIYDESIDGDLDDTDQVFDDITNDFLGYGSEFLGTLVIGESTVIGRTDSGAADIFNITIAAGTELQSVFLDRYENGDANMFMAVQDDALFPENFFFNRPSFENNAPNFLGYSVVGNTDIDEDILDNMGLAGRGFSGPLGPGDYSFYIQQTGTLNDYELDFNVVAAVPEPGSVAALLIVGGIGLRRRWKKR